MTFSAMSFDRMMSCGASAEHAEASFFARFSCVAVTLGAMIVASIIVCAQLVAVLRPSLLVLAILLAVLLVSIPSLAPRSRKHA